MLLFTYLSIYLFVHLSGVWGTPRTILDPPRHFSDKKKSRTYFRQKLLLATSNDPPDTSQMIPNNFKKMSNTFPTNVKILGQSRGPDH